MNSSKLEPRTLSIRRDGNRAIAGQSIRRAGDAIDEVRCARRAVRGHIVRCGRIRQQRVGERDLGDIVAAIGLRARAARCRPRCRATGRVRNLVQIARKIAVSGAVNDEVLCTSKGRERNVRLCTADLERRGAIELMADV